MLNRVEIIGHLGRDPEVRHTGDGKKLIGLSVATSETWKDAQGIKHERTEWHRVTVFNDALVKVAEAYLKKGSRVYLQGELATRKWKDNDGAERWTTEIHLRAFNASLLLLDRKAVGEGAAAQ